MDFMIIPIPDRGIDKIEKPVKLCIIGPRDKNKKKDGIDNFIQASDPTAIQNKHTHVSPSGHNKT